MLSFSCITGTKILTPEEFGRLRRDGGQSFGMQLGRSVLVRETLNRLRWRACAMWLAMLSTHLSMAAAPRQDRQDTAAVSIPMVAAGSAMMMRC